MTSPRPVASKDKLSEFVRSFERFAVHEDLVDTDSESESECESVGTSTSLPVRCRTSNESLEFVDNSLRQSIVFLCIPKLEGALLSSLANTKSADNVQNVLLWVSQLTHQDVLKCVGRFAEVLDGFTSPADPSTLALREFLTFNQRAHNNEANALNSCLVELLVDSGSTVLPPVVHVLLLLLDGQNTEAALLITKLVETLREMTTTATLSKNVANNTQDVLQHIVTLQYILKLLQAHIFVGQDDLTSAESNNSPTLSTTQTRLSHLLKSFAHQYTALFPILGCAVRAAVLHIALCGNGGTNYGLLEGLLSHPVSEATLQETFATLSTRNTAASSSNNAHATHSVGVSVTNGVNMNTVDFSQNQIPSDDEGYVYLQHLSREETIKTLYPLPAGSFLLRPHETSSSQYFLSFRTVGSSTTGTSNTNGGKSGSNGRLSPETTVKHAIIRRTFTPASVPSIPLLTISDNASVATNTTTVQPSSPVKPSTGEDGNTSPLPMLLRQPHVCPATINTTNTNRNGSMTENSNDSTNPTSNAVHRIYSYQCGKIGPCATMIDMLRQISSVLETPLIFTPLTTNTNTTILNAHSVANSAAASSSDIVKSTVADATMVLDINHSFWANLVTRLTADKNVATLSNNMQQVVDRIVCDFACVSWPIAAHAEVMNYMYDLILRTLSVRRFVSQMAADVGLCEKLVQKDLFYASQLFPPIDTLNTPSNSNSGGTGSVLKVYKCLLDVTVGPESTTFHVWLAPYRHYIEQHEQKLHSLLLPPLPLHKWYTPPLERTIRRERTECTNNTTTSALTSPIVTNSTHSVSSYVSNRNVFAAEDELLLAEHLINHISTFVGTRSVRLSNAAGTEYVTLPHCLPAEEVHRLLAQWWEVYVQHESTVAQRVSARRMSERINTKHHTAATVAKSNKADNVTADGIVDPNTISTSATAATAKSVTSIKEFDQDFKLNHHIDYETAIVSSTTTTTSATLSLALYTILKRIHSILSMDMTCKAKDYTGKMIAWVSDELQIVYEVVKPGEYAFSAATRYYCPHHPYEVKVLRDYAQASERVRLGRYVFSSVGQSTSNNNNNNASTNFKSEQKQAGSLSSSVYKSSYFQQNVESVLRDVISVQAVQNVQDSESTRLLIESRVKEVARLWNLLGAEQYLTSAIAHAAELCTREQLPVRYPAPIPDATTTSITNTNSTNVSLQTPTLSHAHSVTVPPKESSSEYNSYLGALQRALYHNALYSRLGFATRTIPIVQVDIYALQEILAVRSMQANSAQAPVAIPSGVSPLTYMNLFNKPTVLTPTASAHGSGALETYTVMRLAHKTSHNPDHTANTNNSTLHHALSSMTLSLPTSGTSTPVSKNGNTHVPLSAKHCPIGTVVGSVHKAEARRTPFEHISNSANTTSSTHTIAPNWSKAQQQAVARAVEYNFREQALFRFALPEGQLSLYPPAGGNNSGVTLQPYPEYSKEYNNQNDQDSSSTTTFTTTTQSGTTLPPTVLTIPTQYFEVPSVLTIAVYERSFFSDTLLGELELDLSCVHEKRMIRGWYPLTLEKSISWMVFLQVRLKTQDMNLDTSTSSNNVNANNPSGASGSIVSNHVASGIPGMENSIGFRDAGDVSSPCEDSVGLKGPGGVNGFSIFKQMDDF